MGIFKLNGIDYMGGGGGGNTNYEELTQLEYDTLTEEEKNNGTIYFITDANSNQDGKFQPVICSESEREIGVWTDGRPLYERTVIISNPSTNGRTNIDDPLFTNCNIISINGYAKRSVQGLSGAIITYNINTYESNIYLVNVFYDEYLGKLAYQLYFSTDTCTELVVICRYTKTTDSPGSGQWTPQGVPAVHYSENEQVVGTWVDGSTIYEKTYTGLSVPTNGTTWVQIAAIDTSSMSDIIDCVAYSVTPTGTLHIALAEYVSTGSVLQVDVVNSIFNRTINIITLRYTKQSSSQGGN